jgi:hypothetical protein
MSNLFTQNDAAAPCQKCGLDFLWQDASQILRCCQCVEPPSLAMIVKIYQAVVIDNQRGFVDATEVCLPIWKADRAKKRNAKFNQHSQSKLQTKSRSDF